MFHTRETYPGTLVFKDGKIEKLNTKTDETISFLVYPYWHPNGRYIVFSVNSTRQAFHANNLNRVEVYDSASDVVVYDTEMHQVLMLIQVHLATRLIHYSMLQVLVKVYHCQGNHQTESI